MESGGKGWRERGGGRIEASHEESLAFTQTHSHTHTHMHVVTPLLPFPRPLYIPPPSTRSYEHHLHPSRENKDHFHHFLLAGKQEM